MSVCTSHDIVNWVVSFGSSICILVCVLFDGLSVAIPIQIHVTLFSIVLILPHYDLIIVSLTAHVSCCTDPRVDKIWSQPVVA